MTSINDDDIEQLRRCAQRTLENHRQPHIGKFFQRCFEEKAPILSSAIYTEASFWRAPKSQVLGAIDIACLGVPMDVSAPYHGGSKFAPKAVREKSLMHGPVHDRWQTIPFEQCAIADYGDLLFSRPHDTAQTVEDIYQAYCKLDDAGITPFAIGGVHTITHPILKALGRKEPLGLIHIDAHADTMTGPMQGEELSDGAVFRNAALDAGIDPSRVVQIGIRGRATPFWDFSYDSGMRVITMEEVEDLGIAGVIEEARKIIGDGPCYLTLDCDGIDANYLPGTQMPEPFGFTSREVRQLIRGMRGLNLVGADVVELCPLVDINNISSNLIGALGFEILCLLADARVQHKGPQRKTHWNTDPLDKTLES